MFTFPTQSNPPRNYEPKLVITATSPSVTLVNVTFPKLTENRIFVLLEPGQFTTINLPSEVISDPNTLEQNGAIVVQAEHDISVVAMSFIDSGPNLGSFQVSPTSGLGTEYVIVDWPASADNFPAEFIITSLYNDTNITYILTTQPTASVPLEGFFILNQYDAIQLQTEKTTGLSFTGSQIWSDKPISIIGGCECADIPLLPQTSCDYVAAHLIPFDKWGVFYSLAPFLERENAGYVIRVVAGRNDTEVRIQNNDPVALNPGSFHEETIVTNDLVTIVADKPILVAQYAMSHSPDGLGDSLMIIVPPIEQYVNEVIQFALFNTSHYQIDEDFISILTECDHINGLLFDGEPIDNSWIVLSDAESVTCAAQNTISFISAHNISHESSSALMTAFLYGFGSSAVSFGHTVGFGLDKITCTVFDDVTNSTKEISCRLAEPGSIYI